MKVGSAMNRHLRRPSSLAVAAALLAFSSTVSPDDGGAAGAFFLKEVQNALSNLEKTGYDHSTHINAETGEFFCDCSGFLGYFLKREAPGAYASLHGEEAPRRSRPLAVTFYETFSRAGEKKVRGWSQVTSLLNAKPGDIVAWRKEKLKKGSPTGHVLILASEAVREEDGSYRLRVIDSTRRIHADDTRAPGSNGVGTGTMWFAVDESGKPIRYYADENPEPVESTFILIGRLTGAVSS